MITLQSKAWAGVFAGILTLTTSATLQAAFVVPSATENPGAALSDTVGLAGTLVADSGPVAFLDLSSGIQGTLRSAVVDRGGGLLDFYYQVANTSQNPPTNNGPAAPLGLSEIYRLQLDGFKIPTTVLGATYTSAPPAAITGLPGFTAGTKPAFSADFQTDYLDGVGFDFSSTHFLGDAANVDAGQVSDWLVVRTSSTTYNPSSAFVDGGFGGAFVSAFAPIPEPTTVVFGLSLAGICVGRAMRGIKRTAKSSVA